MSVPTYVLLFVSAYCLSSVSSIAIDNGVVGTPSVQCLQDAIVVIFSTKNSFTGRIYSKGKYATPRCFVAANRSALQKSSPTLRLEYSDSDLCNVQKLRETNGMVFVTTVMISFHSMFVTKVDRAYRIQCRFQESGATVTQRLEVSTLGTSTYNPPTRQPECKYEILNNERMYGPLGDAIRYAQIGQKVLHTWTCEEPQGQPHCILVHSCSIFDERNERVLIINRAGCTNDRYVLQSPELVSGSQYRVEAHVFKFADRPTVHFSCSIDITPRPDNVLCRAPVCPAQVNAQTAAQRDLTLGGDYIAGADNATESRRPRSAAVLRLSQQSPPSAEASAKTVTLDLDNEISVLDLDTDPSQAYDEIRRLLRFRAVNDARTTGGAVSDQAPAYCITPVLYSSLVIAACLLFVTVVAIVGALVFFRSDASLLKAKLLATARN